MINKHLPGYHNQKKHGSSGASSRPDVGSWILSHYRFKPKDIDLITMPMLGRLSGSNESEQKLIDLLDNLHSTSRLEILLLDDSSDFSLKILGAGELAFSVREIKSLGMMSLDVNSASDTDNQDLGKVFDHLEMAARKAGFDLITMSTSQMPIDEAAKRNMDLYKIFEIPRPISVFKNLSKMGHLLEGSLHFLEETYGIIFAGSDVHNLLAAGIPNDLQELSNLTHPSHLELGLVAEYLNSAPHDYMYAKKLHD